jgi:hypothetical protein
MRAKQGVPVALWVLLDLENHKLVAHWLIVLPTHP